MDILNKRIATNPDVRQAISLPSFEHLAILLGRTRFLRNDSSVEQKLITFRILCDWETPEGAKREWDKMSEDGHGRWGRIQCVSSADADYDVILNSPPRDAVLRKEKSVVFQMEPNMATHPYSGVWGSPNPAEFLRVFIHKTDYNNVEWHLSRSYKSLLNDQIPKNPACNTILSTILSHKYSDPGHIRRIDFIKFAEQKLDIDVYGNNKWDYKRYRGPLPRHAKDDGIFPYKYTFNCENNSIPNYFTEKLIDGILGECLTFYSGCFNVREYINPDAYVYLELVDFEKDLATIKRAIAEDWWSKRIDVIRAEKKKILTQLQFFPRLERVLTKSE
jgi:hypothetical protein